MTLPYDLNILDVVLLSVIALFTLRGALRGFLDEVAGLVGILGGVWLAVILTCAQLLLAWAQKYVPPAQAAVIFALESIFAAVIGWFAGERLGLLGLTGGLCIVLGILITEYPRIMGKSR